MVLSMLALPVMLLIAAKIERLRTTTTVPSTSPPEPQPAKGGFRLPRKQGGGHLGLMTYPPPPLRAHDIRRIAAEAIVDERTVRAYLKDQQRVRSTSAARISAAMRVLGLTPRETGARHA